MFTTNANSDDFVNEDICTTAASPVLSHSRSSTDSEDGATAEQRQRLLWDEGGAE